MKRWKATLDRILRRQPPAALVFADDFPGNWDPSKWATSTVGGGVGSPREPKLQGSIAAGASLHTVVFIYQTGAWDLDVSSRNGAVRFELYAPDGTANAEVNWTPETAT